MLSQKSRHALHAMLYLARQDGSVTAAEIAEAVHNDYLSGRA